MAKDFRVSVPHELKREEAIDRIKGLVAELKKEYGDQVGQAEESWSGNRCEFRLKIRRINLSGTIEVDESSAEIRGTLPFAARLLEGPAKELIAKRARELLS
ncbi:MAG: polyhydroxyalkanoic acid system family protein [Actinomycetota bacterium]